MYMKKINSVLMRAMNSTLIPCAPPKMGENKRCR